MKRKRVFIAAIIVALVALMLISGCARQQPLPQEPQAEPQQQTSQQAPVTEQQQLHQQPTTEAQPQQPPVGPIEADIYEDNLDESLEELSQLE